MAGTFLGVDKAKQGWVVAAPVAAMGAPRRRVMGTHGTAWGAAGVCPSLPAPGLGGRAAPSCPGLGRRCLGPGRCCRSLLKRRKVLREGRTRPQQLCWRGVAQAGSPEGGWGGHWKMPGRTSKVSGTPQPCPVCWGQLGWVSPWKCSRPGPPALGVTLGHHPNCHPGTATVQQCRTCCSVTAGCGMVLTLGGSQCPLDELRKLFWLRRKAQGSREGEHWLGSLPSPLSRGGHTDPPLSLPLSAFQDRTMGSPAHPLSSAPSTMSEVRGPRSAPWWGEERPFSTGSDQAVPEPNWGGFPQPSPDPSPMGHCLGQLWVCRLWGAQGGMLGC